MTDKTITFVVPSYNVEDYLGRCVDSLLDTAHPEDVEVIIVDDGSKDHTPAVADRYALAHPGIVRVIHQENAGHGGACNAGIAAATGKYLKIVDADDWIDKAAYVTYLTFLRAQALSSQPVDLLVSNYVYENTSKHHTRTIRYNSVFESNKRLTWDEIGKYHMTQYLLMHTLTYRTEVLRTSGLHLPEHTFYVDFIFAFQPLPYVKTLTYLNIDLYRYFIGREGQSVQKDVMIQRVDQLLKVNDIMVHAMPAKDEVPEGLYKYMLHYLASQFVVTTVFLTLSDEEKRIAQRDKMWSDFYAYNPVMYNDMRAQELPVRVVTMRGKAGRFLITWGYKISNFVVGFNS